MYWKKKISQFRRVLYRLNLQEKFDEKFLDYTNKTRSDCLRKSRSMLIFVTRNENKEAVIYGNPIPCTNFKSLFKSMVSNNKT